MLNKTLVHLPGEQQKHLPLPAIMVKEVVKQMSCPITNATQSFEQRMSTAVVVIAHEEVKTEPELQQIDYTHELQLGEQCVLEVN